ncbi:MAG TPA: type II toxin-antitoxin system VapC family toxin [Acidimicrobiales bacterium]
MIYLDTSALVKLVFEEAESDALAAWLTERNDIPKLSAELTTIELIRTCRRYDDTAVYAARELLAGLDLIPLTSDLVESASVVGPLELRSLDAIHLASATAVGDSLTAFVVYDSRLGSAASEIGLHVVSPA